MKKLREELDSLDRLMEETEHFVFQQKEQLKHLKVIRYICVCIYVYLRVYVLYVYDVFSWRYIKKLACIDIFIKFIYILISSLWLWSNVIPELILNVYISNTLFNKFIYSAAVDFR